MLGVLGNADGDMPWEKTMYDIAGLQHRQPRPPFVNWIYNLCNPDGDCSGTIAEFLQQRTRM